MCSEKGERRERKEREERGERGGERECCYIQPA